MKIKEDICKWREDIKKLAVQNAKVCATSELLSGEVALLKEQVFALVKITEDMTEAMLALIRQQMGD